MRTNRRLLTLGALAASLAFAAAPAYADNHGGSVSRWSSSGGGSGGRQTPQGVVQSVAANAIVLKALDGGVLNVAVDGGTRFYVGGAPASSGDIKPGFVVTVKWGNGNSAAEIDAVNPTAASAPPAGVSVVTSVRSDRVVVTVPAGGSTTIRVSDKTREFVDGKRVPPGDVKPGDTLQSSGSKGGNSAADELRFGTP